MTRWISLVAAVALVAAACTSSETESIEEPPTEDAGEVLDEGSFRGSIPAPEFPAGLDWLNTGRPLSLEQLRGKLVLLDFWTYGCINCIHNIPELKRLEKEYADELVVIGVHSAKFENESETDNIRQIVLRYELEHPVVNDSGFAVWRTWGAQAWPTLVLIDPAGNVVGNHAGEGIYELFEPVIASLVREFDAEGALDRSPLELKLENAGLPEGVLSFPGKVLADAERSRIFVTDTNHNRIIIADIETGEISGVIGSGEEGFADGDLTTARFADPQGLALDDSGDVLYVADTENHAVRRVDLVAGEVTTIAGTGEKGWPPVGGPAATTPINSPWDLELDDDNLYIAMAGTHQLWLLDLAGAEVGPLVGNAREGWLDGRLGAAELAQPSGIALDATGSIVFADSEGSSVRVADLANDEVITLVGSGQSLFDFGDVDGEGTDVRLQHPLGITVAGDQLYIADTYNSKIKRIDPETREAVTVTGGQGWRDGADALFYEPGGIDAAGDKLYIADTNNHAVRVLDLATGNTSTLVLSGIERFIPLPPGTEIVELGTITVAPGAGAIELDVSIPDGYKANDIAPSTFEWAGSSIDAVSSSIVAPSFPLAFPVDFTNGDLTGDLTVYYCEAETERLCLIEQIQVRAEVAVEDGASGRASVLYEIELPEGL